MLQLSGLLGLGLGVLLTLQFGARVSFGCYPAGATLVALLALGGLRSPDTDAMSETDFPAT